MTPKPAGPSGPRTPSPSRGGSLRLAVLTLLWLAATVPARGLPPPQDAAPTSQWYRGATHAHSSVSDGDVPPGQVVQAYRDLGYHFVVLTDHDERVAVEQLNERYGVPGEFIVLAGEEVSATFGDVPVHLTAINLEATVDPVAGASIAATIRANREAIRQQRGLAILNHPNLGWTMTPRDIVDSGVGYIEIHNAHPTNNTGGGGGVASVEGTWDRVLTSGSRVYGVAADDAHDFGAYGRLGDPASGPRRLAPPGQAWVMVRSPELSADGIVGAMRQGDFYATTGVEIEQLEASDQQLRLRLRDSFRYRIDVPGSLRFRTLFIGWGGRILAEDGSPEPTYRFTGEEGYVRARIVASDGSVAWTQPVFVLGPGTPES